MSTGAKLTWAVIVWLLAAILLLFIAVMDAQASSPETLALFRTWSSHDQMSNLNGIYELTNSLGLVCKRPRTLGEYQAAMNTRQFDLAKPWVLILGQLWNEDGCLIPDVKPDA